MIKRLIFDLDNTLIEWKNEYNKVVEEALKEANYPYTEELVNKINEKEDEFGKKTSEYNKVNLLNYLNNTLKLELNSNFINIWLKKVEYCVPEKMAEEDYETLKYLSERYELVVLTNYFLIPQKARLEKLGILKFFKEVYGESVTKPNKESFLKAIGDKRIDECAMIGDDIETDIKGAKNAGIQKIIWKDNKNKVDEYKSILNGVDVITSLKQLKDIF